MVEIGKLKAIMLKKMIDEEFIYHAYLTPIQFIERHY